MQKFMQKKTISRDLPIAELTLRRYEKPDFSGRELLRKLCLSLGLLQPGDSRDIIVDILGVMLKAGRELSSEEIGERVIAERKKNNLPLVGIASSNIRRQLKRLRDLLIAEKIANSYRMNENSKLEDIFEEKIKGFLLPSITSRIREYAKKIDGEA